jgi:UDP-N-acetylmuramoyl-L-alanyl-D-glutamate--2,6-diaminopimelate ligase
MRLEEVFGGWLDVPAKLRGVEVSGVACDSRRVRPGDLFVAVAGEATDGHRFVGAALAAGAAAIVGERRPVELGLDVELRVPYFRVQNSRAVLGRAIHVLAGAPSHRLGVVGVTGTKGKTTTTWLIAALIDECGGKSALFGTVENRVAGRIFPASQTTPSSVDIHTWLREHADSGGSHAVLEVSSHAISQSRTEGVRFAVGVFTNCAPEHLDYHRTFEEYRETKVGFFDRLERDAFAVISREDSASTRIARRTRSRVVWYGSGPEDGVSDLAVTPEGIVFAWKDQRIETSLLGYHNFLNLAAAISAVEALGFERSRIAAAARRASAPPGRLENVASPKDHGFRVVVDYAHTDGSLEAVLRTLRPLTPGRLITIFGCGGDRDRTKRPRMGRVAEAGSDHVIVTSDNPRTETPARILEEITAGFTRPRAAEVVEDRREAIALAVRMARRGDTVLIAGKGHETYQDFGSRRIHFDDRETAREFLGGSLLGSTR